MSSSASSIATTSSARPNPGSYVTEYTYGDAVYDGRQRSSGVSYGRARNVGDANSPTSITETTFLLGECEDEVGDGVCQAASRWRDNPREALKGLPVMTETFDESGTHLLTAHTTQRLRRLYVGLDGREVRHAFSAEEDTFKYDTGPFTPSASTVHLPEVELERTKGTIQTDRTRAVTLRSAGRAHGRSTVHVDHLGNLLEHAAHGCIEGCSSVDETITHNPSGTPSRRPSGGSPHAQEWLEGSQEPGARRQNTATSTPRQA